MIDDRMMLKWLPWALLAIGAGALGSAYTAEFVFGLEPCVLCLYQRVPYGVVIALGLAAVFVSAPRMRGLIALSAGLVFLSGAGIAFYHVGVEQTWWTSAAPCGGGTEGIVTTQDFLAALQKKPEKSCGDIDWTLFGLSMATYNVAVSLALAVASLIAARKLKDLDPA